MFSDISDDELLSATQLIESTEDLCAFDVSVDELVGASQQFDVSSLYDDDAEQRQRQSATTSVKITRFAQQLSVCCSAQSFYHKYREWRDVGGFSFR